MRQKDSLDSEMTGFSRLLVLAIAGTTLLTADAFTPPSTSQLLKQGETSSFSRPMAAESAGDDATADDLAMDKATKAMTAFTNRYLKNTDTTLCNEKSIPAVVIRGLAEHKVSLGAPLCPCRFYEDKEAEVKAGYWNCPCVPMRERRECHCMLFLTEDNAFAGPEQVGTNFLGSHVCMYTRLLIFVSLFLCSVRKDISYEEVVKLGANMKQ